MTAFLKLGDAESPPRFCKYWYTIFYAAIFFGQNTHFGHKYSMWLELLPAIVFFTLLVLILLGVFDGGKE